MNIALLNDEGKHCYKQKAQNLAMHIGKRIQRLMALKKVGTKAMAAYCEVTPGAVSNWFSSGRISKEKLAKAAELLEVSTDSLISGDFEINASNVANASVGVTRIPLISYVQAGAWTEVIDNFQPGDADEWLMTDLKMSVHAFALEIKGLSMLPDFNPGDRVIIDPDVSPQPGDFVVAKNGGNEATFKKYRPRGAAGDGSVIFELVPLNEDFPSIRSDTEPLRIVGTMVEHRRYRRPR